ncbi:MAG: hypothetical protein AAF414_01595 [Pseudomonadota bacterium]
MAKGKCHDEMAFRTITGGGVAAAEAFKAMMTLLPGQCPACLASQFIAVAIYDITRGFGATSPAERARFRELLLASVAERLEDFDSAGDLANAPAAGHG